MQKIINTKENSKFERINQIALRLKQKPHSIKELASIFKVSTKTIQRDLYDVLKDYGAKKSGNNWYIDENDKKDNLNHDEKTVINILDNVSKNMGSNFYSKAHILLTQISQQLNHPIFIHSNIEKLNENNFENFEKIEKAIRDKKEIYCFYNGYKFKVKPLKLAMFDGFWYLLLFDSSKNDTFKKFHFKSIKDIEITNKSFEVSKNLEDKLKNANSAWFRLSTPKVAKLLLSSEIAKYFERKPYKRQSIIGKDKDGSVEIEIEYTHEMEIKPLIYYYIPFIKVLSPKSLADLVREEIGDYYNEINV